jgi:hypothetical protein
MFETVKIAASFLAKNPRIVSLSSHPKFPRCYLNHHNLLCVDMGFSCRSVSSRTLAQVSGQSGCEPLTETAEFTESTIEATESLQVEKAGCVKHDVGLWNAGQISAR